MSEDNNHNDNKKKPIAKMGDIITVGGYDGMEFRVFASSYVKEMNAHEEFVEILYDVVSLSSGEFMLADHYDIEVVYSPKRVDYEQLKKHADDNSEAIQSILEDLGKKGDVGDITAPIYMGDYTTADDAFEDEVINDTVDALLDEMSDWLALIKLFGEDAWYRENINRIEELIRQKVVDVL